MSLVKSPEEKLNAVQEAYLLHIVPNIQQVYELANQVRESFILAHCTILSLSGFYAGSRETNGDTYRKFVRDFFPKGYSPESLWKDLRNGLVHGYTFTVNYILSNKHPEMHLHLIPKQRNDITGEKITVL